ncbi:hypothetical protein BH11PSE13_BH11PSE13_12370 [soil metagenome]
MESLTDALVECVRACGGSKAVGPVLWPEKTPDAAQRLLLDCLNDDRPAKLSPEQLLLVLRLARQRGHHGGINYIAGDLGYGTPVPIEPRDEIADLQRQYIEAARTMSKMADRIDKLASGTAAA